MIVAVVLLGTIAVGVALADNASTASQPGQSTYQAFLGNLASALNIDQTTLTNALKTAGTQTVNQELQSGQIAQQQANQMLSQINSGKPFGFMGMGFGRPGSVGRVCLWQAAAPRTNGRLYAYEAAGKRPGHEP